MIKPLNVLSLCDGISTGMIACKKAGIEVGYYLASEIDKNCIKASHHNFPKILQLGDIYSIDVSTIPFQIDIVFCGFPCQSFSIAGKQKKFDDPRGQVFWQGVKILYQCMKRWPNVKFLFENVRMDKHSCSIISNTFGFDPIFIDSALVSAQTRKRNYWTNIEGVEQPKDRGIYLRDILEDNVDECYHLSAQIRKRLDTAIIAKKLKELQRGVIAEINASQDGKDFAVHGKSGCLSAGHGNVPKVALEKSVSIGVVNSYGDMRHLSGDKSLCIDANYHKGIDTHAARTHVAMLSPTGTAQAELIYSVDGKSIPPSVRSGGVGSGTGLYAVAGRLVNRKLNEHGKRDDYNDDLNLEPQIEINKNSGKTNCLSTVDKDNVIVHNLQPRNGKGSGGKGHIMRYPGNKAYCLDTSGTSQAVEYDVVIRRLTEIECARLQGCPDNFLSILSSTAQYKAYGNGWQADTIAHILSYYKQ